MLSVVLVDVVLLTDGFRDSPAPAAGLLEVLVGADANDALWPYLERVRLDVAKD